MRVQAAAFGWLLTLVGMVVHLAGVYAGAWSPDHVTWYIPLFGCSIMAFSSWLSA